jgi:branched-chain amino acid transport system permease protein
MTTVPEHTPVSSPVAGRVERRAEFAGAWQSGWLRALLLAAAAGIMLLLMPFFLAAYPLIILCHMLVFSIACLALNLVYGTAGMLSLGHATYFGVAAYAGAVLYRFSAVDSFELYLLSGMFSSTIFAAVIGYLCVRTTKIFFSILTLAFSMVVYSLVINGAVFRLLGGIGWALYLLGSGSMYLPRLTILGKEFAAGDFIPAFYNVILVAFLASTLLLWRISNSPFGQALKAIRDNDTRAAFIGIPVREYRWYAFIISGFFMGLAGCLYGQLARQITPEQLHWLFSAQLVLATVLGGTRHFLGPILGAFAFVGLDEIASRWTVGRTMIFGVLLIVVVFAFPRGIAGGFVAVRDAIKRY